MTESESNTPSRKQFSLTLGTLLLGLVLLNISVFFSTGNPSPGQLQYLLFRFDPRHWPAPSPFSVTLWLLCLWLAIDTAMLVLKRYASPTFYAQKIVPIRKRFTIINVLFAVIFGLNLLYFPPYRLFYWRVFHGILAWLLIALFVESLFFIRKHPIFAKAEAPPPAAEVWNVRFSYLALFFIPAYLFGWFLPLYRFGFYQVYWPYVYGPLTEWIVSGKIPWHLSVLPILALFMIIWLLRIAKKSRSHH